MSTPVPEPAPQARFQEPRAACLDAILTLVDHDPFLAIKGVDIERTSPSYEGGWAWSATFASTSIGSLNREPMPPDWQREQRSRVSLALNALWIVEDAANEKELEEAKTDAALIASHPEYVANAEADADIAYVERANNPGTVEARPEPFVDDRLTEDEVPSLPEHAPYPTSEL